MDDQKRDGRLIGAAAGETEASMDKVSDDELSDDEDTSGYIHIRGIQKKPDEDAGPDGRVHIA
ncbi:MAG: hypothetical protein AVDCRST_MAG93-2890 [uncultured Chloroflexia bacterium]|uniref:Uncharacterized protein n=1 Tax=uncultured Chloroflexia bacterium TaxID=1672391 RepID=A0A6J4JC44_9CHLR|nr:MAG: hypothetical protein AVDCRST_MAG93-2890 [uncultured Chloroflexia bacterium]